MNRKILKLKGKSLVIIDWANVYGWFENLKWELDPKKLYDYLKTYPEIYDIRFYFGTEKGNKKSEEFQKEIKEIGYTLITKEVKRIPIYLEKSHFREKIKKLRKILLNTIIQNQKFSVNLLELINKVERITDDVHWGMDETGMPRLLFKVFFDERELRKTYDTILLLNKETQKVTTILQNTLSSLKEPIYRRKCDFDCEICLDILNDLNKFQSLILFSGDGDFAIIVKELIKRGKQVIVVALKNAMGKEYAMIPKGLFINIKKLKEFIQK